MLKSVLLRLLAVMLHLLVLAEASTYAHMYTTQWNYDESSFLGPNHWNNSFPMCNGEKQSPVNIDTSQVWYKAKLTTFQMPQYESIPRGAHWEMWNMGYTVHITLEGDYYLSDGDLPGTYKAMYLEFHFGDKDFHGSEHTIDDERFPLEIQMIHYNTRYGSFDSAISEPDGIAILAFFVRITEHGNPVLNQIVNNLENIPEKGSHLSLRPVPLYSLMPLNLNTYYRYHGSLTVPSCAESVIWTVFGDTAEISTKQLQKFRSIPNGQFDHHDETKLEEMGKPTEAPPRFLLNNFRPLQQLGERTVYSSNSEDATLLTSPLGSPVSFTVALFVGVVIMFLFLHYRERPQTVPPQQNIIFHKHRD